MIAVIVVGYTLYANYRAELQAQQEAMMNQNRRVEVQVTRNVYTATIDLSGYVEAYDIQEARFRATGPITSVNVEEGDRKVTV